MWKKIFITLVGVVLVVGGIVYAKLGQFQAMGEAAAGRLPPPETVTAMHVESASWEQFIPAVGTLAAVQGVTVSAEIAGRVSTINFSSGAAVKAGDVLVTLDTSTEKAQLQAAEAAAALANANLARTRQLGKQRLVSPAEVDAASAQAREAAAQVRIVKAALDLKTIRAPFDGRLGLSQINDGQVLRQGDPIVELQNIDPIHVNFSVPQHQLAKIGTGMQIRVRSDVAPERTFTGKITAVSPVIDPRTRNASAQALVDNPDGVLNAGMFVKVDAVMPAQADVLAIAASSVLYAPYGNSVFVIEKAVPEDGQAQNDQAGLKLRQQFVRLGAARGDFVEVIDGLKAGDQVVTSGAFKLRSGMPVVVDNTLAPKPSLNPTPANS